MSRQCLFCGSTDLSKEHIFAKWLLKELNIYNGMTRMYHANFAGIKLSNQIYSFSKLVNGLVCKQCNNGWMNSLEEESRDHIFHLMNILKNYVKNDIE